WAVAQSTAFADGFVAEFGAYAIHGALGGGALAGPAIDKIGRIAFVRRADVVQTDAEKAIRRAVGLVAQALARHAEDTIGKLRRCIERHAAGENPELRRLELEHDRAAAKLSGFGAAGDALGLPPEDLLEFEECSNVVLERGFR